MDTAAVALPRVSGRHRNHALASARRARAIRLVTEGQTYQQVADHLGYSNRGTVHRLVRTALMNETVNAVSELRRLESDRLDALLHSVWDQAMAGDLNAVRVATAVVMARVKLLGLEGAGSPPTTAGRTVVLLSEERAALGLD
ncbi:helix-turn-helix domain-containing protein [Dermatophilaceae bacterium Soc4.6]